MENDLVSLFLFRKKQNVIKYSEIFLKYTLKNKVGLKKIINEIIDIYFDKFYTENNSDYSILSNYFKINDSIESLMKDILVSSILFYKNNDLESQIKSDIKTIIVLSNTIYLCLLLDNKVNEYDNYILEVDDRFNTFKTEYISKIKINEEELENFTNDLFIQVKKDDCLKSKIPKIVSKVCNTKMIVETDESSTHAGWQILNLKSAPKYDIIFGTSQVTKSSSTKSGDCYSLVRMEDGKILMAICDGMGSGKDARKTGKMALNLLEKLLTPP